MSAAQVSSDEYGLKATTTQLHYHYHPPKHVAAAVSNPPLCFTPVSRVITKESLRDSESPTRFELLPARLQRQVDNNDFGDDEHSLQSSLFEFSLLDPDARDCDGELLALPLVPLTGSSIDVDRELLAPPTLQNLDGYAALLSFDSSSVFHEDSDSTTATSSLAAVSTVAAIVASQQQPHQQPLSHERIDGSVPSLVAVYPDCSTSTQPSVLVSAHSKPKSDRTTTRGTGVGSSQVKSISCTSDSTSTTITTTRSKKNKSSKKQDLQLHTQQGINSIMEQEPDPMATVPSPPPLPEAGNNSASSALNGQKYTPSVVTTSSQGGMVIDPTATSTLHYHQAVNPIHHSKHNLQNHQAVANHVPLQGGAVATRPRLVNMGDRHLSAGSGHVPSPSENNNHHNQSNTVVTNIHPPAANASAAAAENTGRWTAEEHRLFLQGLEQHGKGWKKIATLIQSRTVVQIRTHAQKYFQKLTKASQAGEGGLLLVGGGGGGVDASGMVRGGGTHMISAGTAEGDGTVGIAIPLGPDGQPVVSMRTTSHATPASTSSGSNGMGSDSSLWGHGVEGGAGAMHGSGRSRRRVSNVSGGGTKRRVIGNVVRSAVREGRNIKRQKIAELKRKGGGGDLSATTPVADALPSSSMAPSPGPTASTAEGGGKDDHELVPNPLPSVSHILDPYIPPPPPPGAPLVAPGRVGGPGRQQLVHTATHGTLPMAALEDAVFRLLTPATGALPPPPSQQQQSHLNNTPAVVDPLAPQSNVINAKVPLTHTQYPPLSGGGGATAVYPQGMLLNYSPTGVADMALLPSWVDAKNPPSWYNDGSDIDTLLEDADCLNWLSDTGDLDETYPPAMAEPTAIISSSSTTANSIDAISGQTIPSTATIQDPVGGMFHPSTDSLSFLVDPPERHHVVEDVNQLSSFLDEPAPTTSTVDVTYASATEAVEATTSALTVSASATIHIPEHHIGESVTNLVGFPDLDMGDEQAFVSALLENSGPSIMSFPKLNSDLHICDNNISQENLVLESGVTEEVSEGKVDEYA